MSTIEPAQGNQKVIRTNVPVLFVQLARLKLCVLAKEAWYYDVPFMHLTIGR